jgi:uncharacterized protein
VLAVAVALAASIMAGRAATDEARILATAGLEIEVVIPAPWSIVERSETDETDELGEVGERPDHPFIDAVQVAAVDPETDGQILVARLFRRGDLDRTTAGLRGVFDQPGGRIVDEQPSTLDGRDARVLDYELPSGDAGSLRLHRAYVVELDDATRAWIDIGGLPADDDGPAALDRIADTLRVRATPAATEVELLTMEDDGQVAEYWTPRAQDGAQPGVLLVGGSEGDVPVGGGPLALAGYPTLALAYHGVDGLPQALADIPLETFRDALERLATRPEVDAERLIIWGSSRGGEAALLVASSFPDSVDAVVANVPSDVAGAGVPTASRPAWTLAGEPVARTTEEGQMLRFGFEVPIEVERIEAPVLLTCGSRDTLWPSCPMSRRIVERFEEFDHPHPVVLRAYEDAGHFAVLPPLQVPSDVREASNEGWRDAVAFLDEQ